MRVVRSRSLVPLLALACIGPAQERLPVPDAPARAAGNELLLTSIARLSVASEPGAAPQVERLLAAAADTAQPAALRHGLLLHAQRVALAAQDVATGLRAAEALARAFAVDDAIDACLRGFEDAHAPAQTLSAGLLAHAASLLERDAGAMRDATMRAERVAPVDAPPGLAAYVAFAAQALRDTRIAFESTVAAPGDAVVRARYHALYLGDWSAALAAALPGNDAFERTLRSKVDARANEDAMALARVAERWLEQGRQERHAIARWQLQRRAAQLLQPLAYDAGKPPHDPLEVARARKLLAAATADAAVPGVGVRVFKRPDDLAAMLVSGGDWRIADGALRGRSLGPDVATRATVRTAWSRIDSVTIHGGVASADGLNFRVAVGDVNVLFNWEVADQNHVYVGDRVTVTQPRALRAGVEHRIELRQHRENVLVLVDDAEIARVPAVLAGAVTIYPAIGSEIFVREVRVVGDVDLGRVVTSPGPAR